MTCRFVNLRPDDNDTNDDSSGEGDNDAVDSVRDCDTDVCRINDNDNNNVFFSVPFLLRNTRPIT